MGLSLLSAACGPQSPVVDEPVTNDPSCLLETTLTPEESVAYFPYRANNRWTFAGYKPTPSGDESPLYQSTLDVAGVADMLVMTEKNARSLAETTTRHLQLDFSGLRNVDGAPRVGTPYHEVQFPLQLCTSYEAYLVPVGHSDGDLDHDGRGDAHESRAIVTTRGFERVVTQAGSFDDALRVERTITETTTLSADGRRIVNTANIVEWYAKGIGPVRRIIGDKYVGFDEQLMGFSVDGAMHGVSPVGELVGNLAVPTSDVTNPGRAAVAFDGTRFLTVETQTGGTSNSGPLIGLFVSQAGEVEQKVTIASDVIANTVDIAFDGHSYLIVFEHDGISAVQVSVTGVATAPIALAPEGRRPAVTAGPDGTFVAFARGFGAGSDVAGVTVSSAGVPSAEFSVANRAGSRPATAFDGTNFLVIWEELVPTSNIDEVGNTDLYAARVTPFGQSLDPNGFSVVTTRAPESDVHVSFDGTNYLAAWFYATNPTFIGEGEIHAARIGSDGSLLDGAATTGGFIMSANANHKGHPRITRFGDASLVVWEVPQYYGAAGIFGARVGRDGTVLDGNPSGDGMWLSDVRAIGTNGVAARLVLPVVAATPDRALIVWLNADDASLHDSLLFP